MGREGMRDTGRRDSGGGRQWMRDAERGEERRGIWSDKTTMISYSARVQSYL